MPTISPLVFSKSLYLQRPSVAAHIPLGVSFTHFPAKRKKMGMNVSLRSCCLISALVACRMMGEPAVGCNVRIR